MSKTMLISTLHVNQNMHVIVPPPTLKVLNKTGPSNEYDIPPYAREIEHLPVLELQVKGSGEVIPEASNPAIDAFTTVTVKV